MPKKPQHSVRFLNLVDDAKTRITEISAEDVLRRFRKGEAMNLVDVREYREYLNSHIGNALHIGKGVIERDIEQNYRDLDAELILYCGGGYRSALAADAIQRMGYTSVRSMAGGFREWKNLGGPISLM